MRGTTTAIVAGSLQAIAQDNNKPLAAVFADAEALVIIDVSISMEEQDARGGQSRYAAACEELRRVQKKYAGKIAVIQFSSDAAFCPGGLPSQPHGGTNLADALDFARVADGCGLKIMLISDGEPNDESGALDAALRWKDKINTIYVGPEDGEGAAFLRRLARATGGQASVNQVHDLANRVETLLLTSGN